MRKDSPVIKGKCTMPETAFRRLLDGASPSLGSLLFIGSLAQRRASLFYRLALVHRATLSKRLASTRRATHRNRLAPTHRAAHRNRLALSALGVPYSIGSLDIYGRLILIGSLSN